MLRSALALSLLSLLLLIAVPTRSADGPFDQSSFEALMQRVAAGWNEGDARAAADCFAPDALYSEPPDRQLYSGREALFEFFGGDDGRTQPMHMHWHHLAYNPETGVGMGEFSFWIGDSDPSHGVIVVRIYDGLIANWREYYYESELHWEEFTATNPF